MTVRASQQPDHNDPDRYVGTSQRMEALGQNGMTREELRGLRTEMREQSEVEWKQIEAQAQKYQNVANEYACTHMPRNIETMTEDDLMKYLEGFAAQIERDEGFQSFVKANSASLLDRMQYQLMQAAGSVAQEGRAIGSSIRESYMDGEYEGWNKGDMARNLTGPAILGGAISGGLLWLNKDFTRGISGTAKNVALTMGLTALLCQPPVLRTLQSGATLATKGLVNGIYKVNLLLGSEREKANAAHERDRQDAEKMRESFEVMKPYMHADIAHIYAKTRESLRPEELLRMRDMKKSFIAERQAILAKLPKSSTSEVKLSKDDQKRCDFLNVRIRKIDDFLQKHEHASHTFSSPRIQQLESLRKELIKQREGIDRNHMAHDERSLESVQTMKADLKKRQELEKQIQDIDRAIGKEHENNPLVTLADARRAGEYVYQTQKIPFDAGRFEHNFKNGQYYPAQFKRYIIKTSSGSLAEYFLTHENEAYAEAFMDGYMQAQTQQIEQYADDPQGWYKSLEGSERAIEKNLNDEEKSKIEKFMDMGIAAPLALLATTWVAVMSVLGVKKGMTGMSNLFKKGSDKAKEAISPSAKGVTVDLSKATDSGGQDKWKVNIKLDGDDGDGQDIPYNKGKGIRILVEALKNQKKNHVSNADEIFRNAFVPWLKEYGEKHDYYKQFVEDTDTTEKEKIKAFAKLIGRKEKK